MIKDSPPFDTLDTLRLDRSEDPMAISRNTDVYISKYFADSLTQVLISDYPNMTKIYLSYYSFIDATEFVVENMPVLETIHIGSHCLRQSDLYIRNCSRLTSIMINDKSFENAHTLLLQGKIIAF